MRLCNNQARLQRSVAIVPSPLTPSTITTNLTNIQNAWSPRKEIPRACRYVQLGSRSSADEFRQLMKEFNSAPNGSFLRCWYGFLPSICPETHQLQPKMVMECFVISATCWVGMRMQIRMWDAEDGMLMCCAGLVILYGVNAAQNAMMGSK